MAGFGTRKDGKVYPKEPTFAEQYFKDQAEQKAQLFRYYVDRIRAATTEDDYDKVEIELIQNKALTAEHRSYLLKTLDVKRGRQP